MRTRARIQHSWLPLAATALLGLAACSDSDTSDGGVADAGTADGSTDGGSTDGGPTPDGGRPDAGEVTMGCDNPPLVAPAQGNCEYTAGTNTAVLLRGDILSSQGLLENGHVLVGADGKIACSACDCSSHPAFAAASVIACADSVISPALINMHDHITFTETAPTPPPNVQERYDHRHDWRRGLDEHTRLPSVRNQGGNNGISWGELRNLMAGATSINGSGGADGLLRNLDRSGSQQEGLNQDAIYYSTFPLGDTDGRKRSSGCGYESFDRPDSSRFQGAVAYTPHIAEGIEVEARNEFLCLSGGQADGSDIITDKTAVIHGIGLLPPDWAAMAADGSSLIWSPRSNISLYGVTANLITARESGVNITLGTDWSASGSMNMLRELRCADEYNTRNLGGFFTDRELWLLATANAANAARSIDKIGTLAEGREADISIFAKSGSAAYRAVLDADPEDVVLVMRGGKPLYGDEGLMTNLGATTGCEALDVCGVQKAVCSEAETGSTIAQHRSAIASNAYDLFFCETPPMEPSCIPFRSGEFMGVGSGTDDDGDGVANDLDNCPAVFNPIRPMDNGVQADFDNDMVGDACDGCPLEDGVSGCAPPDPNDLDGDGFPNDMDNCPGLANMDQADMDMDMIGDVCDACPEESNLGGASCSFTLYQVKQGMVTGRAAIKNVQVTAVSARGYFAQHVDGDADFTSPDFSGVFVFTNADGMKPGIGDRIDIDAEVSEFFGQIQMANGSFTSISTGNAAPTALVVSPADVAAESPRGAALEGVLIEVQSVTVTEVEPTPGPGDGAPTNEFVVGAGLRVNDLMYRLDPAPQVGEALSFVRGVLRFANGNYKLEPRDAADVGASAGLFGFNPATVFVAAGTNGVPTGGLQVMLTRPALADAVIMLSSSDAGFTVPAMVTVPAGMTGVDVSVDAPALLMGAVTLTATFNGESVTGEAVVYDDTSARLIDWVNLTPSVMPIAGSANGMVRLNLPAGSAGEMLTASVTPMGLATVSSTIGIASGATEGSFTVTAGAAAGTGQVVLQLGTQTATVTFEIVEGGSRLVINEVDYDQPGSDSAEFVEIFNNSASMVDLSGLAIVTINGNGGSEYGRYPLSGTLAPGAYLVLANSGVTVPSGVATVMLPSNGLQNGAPDAVALIDTNAGTLVDALSYEGALNGVNINGVSGAVDLAEGTATAIVDLGPGSLIRVPNGVDTDDASLDWALSTTPTPGAAN